MSVPDEIVREMHLRAPIERVWAAITRPEELTRWFGTGARVELRPGGAFEMAWDQFEDAAPGEVVEVDEPRRLVFTWHPFGHMKDVRVDPALRTRVEFDLEARDGCTFLRVRESGFAALPEAIAARSHADNTGGWASELAELRDYVEGAARG